jgi:hypothetical protein
MLGKLHLNLKRLHRPSQKFGNNSAAYASSLDNVKTTGDSHCCWFSKDSYSDTTVPKFNVEIASNNASFNILTYQKVQNIVIDTKIINNETGILNDTYVNLDKLSSKIDQDVLMLKQILETSPKCNCGRGAKRDNQSCEYRCQNSIKLENLYPEF